MGMFDSFFIDKALLPVSEEDKIRIGDNREFQTKDLDCILSDIKLNNDGQLVIRRFGWDFDTTQKNGLGTMGVIIETDTRYDTLSDYHGYFHFYTSVDKEWFEFQAKFTDGKLVDIERINQRIT